MDKIAFLGDSILLYGYGPVIKETLGKEYDVFVPKENCCYCQKLYRSCFDEKENLKDASIIQFNSGEWDVSDIFANGENVTPLDIYVRMTVRTAKILQTYAKAVIFATTTPVKNGHEHNKTEDIIRFNEAVVPELEKIGVVINDLFSIVNEDIENNIIEDKIHLSEGGAKKCAEQTEKIIREEMKKINGGK